MAETKAKLHPISKLELFQISRKEILDLMDAGKITPERATEMIKYITKVLSEIVFQGEVDTFYEELITNYTECQGMKKAFEKKEREQLDHIIAILVERFMNKGEFETAEKIIAEMKKLENDSGKSIFDIRNQYPEEFDEVVKEVNEKETNK